MAEAGEAERREIRSARFPYGLPDRCDDTVWEAHTDAWLLLIFHPDHGYRIVGMAQDYESARDWLTGADGDRPD